MLLWTWVCMDLSEDLLQLLGAALLGCEVTLINSLRNHQTLSWKQFCKIKKVWGGCHHLYHVPLSTLVCQRLFKNWPLGSGDHLTRAHLRGTMVATLCVTTLVFTFLLFWDSVWYLLRCFCFQLKRETSALLICVYYLLILYLFISC